MNQNPALITPHAFASRLPKSGQIIYEAPSQRRYIIVGVITGALFLFAGAGAVYIRETEPTAPPWWVRLGNGVVVVFTTGAGLWTIAGTMGICKRITAFPATKARDGVRVMVEGSYFWVPWRRRIVEAELGDVVIFRSMADCQKDTKRKIVPQIPDDEISPFILGFVKFGRAFGACVKEIPNACFRQTHPSLQIRGGGKRESVMFKLDIRGQAFGGAKGESFLRVALLQGGL
jgi:hypothetical protein